MNRNVLSPLQINQRRQLAEQIAALTEEIEELRSRQAMILHNLDCKNNGEAKRFGSYLDKLEEMQEKLATQREIHTQQLSIGTKQYLEIEYDQSSRLNENRHCSTKAVSMMQPYSSLNSL